MKEKDDLKEIEFQIFRINHAIKQYLERCKTLDIEPSTERVDELLEKLAELMKKRDSLKE